MIEHNYMHPEAERLVPGATNGTGTANLPSKDSTEEMLAEFEVWFNSYIARVAPSYVTALETAKVWEKTLAAQSWQAAIASKQAELESWQIVAEKWRVDAVDWSRNNAELVAELDAVAISEFSGEYPPTFRQGMPVHEMEELVTAQRCSELVALLAKAAETIDALQAKIAEANRKASAEADWFICGELPDGRLQYTQDKNDEEYAMQLFTRPPIQSDRELELLAVIEQMREALVVASQSCVYSSKPQIQKALALTPDMTALKEHDARVLEGAAIACDKEGAQPNEGMSEYADGFNNGCDQCAATIRRMASELRQPKG